MYNSNIYYFYRNNMYNMYNIVEISTIYMHVELEKQL